MLQPKQQQPEQQQPEQTAFVKQAEVKSEHKFLGSIKAQKGLTVFEVDTTNKTIQKAKFDMVSYPFKGGIRKKLVVKKDCIYIECLNEKNAKRKVFQKYGLTIT